MTFSQQPKETKRGYTYMLMHIQTLSFVAVSHYYGKWTFWKEQKNFFSKGKTDLRQLLVNRKPDNEHPRQAVREAEEIPE